MVALKGAVIAIVLLAEKRVEPHALQAYDC